MKNVHPLRAARRKVRRQAFLGVENPRCVKCGEGSVECLEVHEIAGFRRDRDTQGILCRNCHRKQTIHLLDAGVEMVCEESPLVRTSQWMLANAVFLRGLADGWERQAKLIQQLEEEREI